MARLSSSRARAGTSLMEVLVGLAVFSILGFSVVAMLRGSARGTARAGENQLATLLAARVMDQFLYCGYETLSRQGGASRELDFAKLGVSSEASAANPGELVIDGCSITGRYTVEQVDRGMVRVLVTLGWRRAGQGAGDRGGTLTLVRYVADPTVCLSTRGSFGGTQA